MSTDNVPTRIRDRCRVASHVSLATDGGLVVELSCVFALCEMRDMPVERP